MTKISRVPITVFLELTKRCNLNCLHCCADGGQARPEELSTEDWIDFVRYLAKLKVFRIVITGGEPLIRNDFFTIVREIRKNQSVVLNTNATLVTDKIAQQLSQLGISVISVSIDGSTPEIHDRNRGSGSFIKTIKGIESLLKHNCRVVINSVVTRINYQDIENIVALAKRLGVEKIGFNHVHPTGRARTNKEQIVPSLEEDTTIADELWKVGQKYGAFVGSWYIDQMKLYNSPPNPHGGIRSISRCSAGKETIAITANGDIVPCNNLQELVCGNIRRSDFARVWQYSSILAEFRSLFKLKVTSLEGCQDCHLVSICPGGCRANAYQEYGSLTAPDPFCRLNPINIERECKRVHI
ncbi:MAG: radical SAM protein [Bacillota bacterium]